jgi:succinate dehydrogenase / fumarate reductase iron-sulfur subunit
MRLRRRATNDYEIKDSNNGYGHEKAFVNLIEKYGTLHESQLLPRSYGDGSLIKSQIKPQSIAALTGQLPTVINGLKSGKVSPIKAVIHHKLPDQKQVRKIFKTIESNGDRLELNLYIVGEEAEDEDSGGKAAEGGVQA